MKSKVVVGTFVFLIVISLIFGLYEQEEKLTVFQCKLDSDCSLKWNWVEFDSDENIMIYIYPTVQSQDKLTNEKGYLTDEGVKAVKELRDLLDEHESLHSSESPLDTFLWDSKTGEFLQEKTLQ